MKRSLALRRTEQMRGHIEQMTAADQTRGDDGRE